MHRFITRLIPLSLALGLLLAGGSANAGNTSCKMKFDASGWAFFITRGSGEGSITCANEQKARVRLRRRSCSPGGPPTTSTSSRSS